MLDGAHADVVVKATGGGTAKEGHDNSKEQPLHGDRELVQGCTAKDKNIVSGFARSGSANDAARSIIHLVQLLPENP